MYFIFIYVLKYARNIFYSWSLAELNKRLELDIIQNFRIFSGRFWASYWIFCDENHTDYLNLHALCSDGGFFMKI